MAGNRTIIGSESDDTRHIDLDRAPNLKVTVPVTIYDTSGNQINILGGLVANSYDSISLTYDSNQNISTVVYKLGTTLVATLTLTYDSNQNLISIKKS